MIHRVLRRDQEERPLQRVNRAVHGHLPFRHRLQERRLGARGGPVDLVRQHDVREERPAAELELGGLGIEHRCAGNVVRQQIRRALDPLERAADTLRNRPRQHRLGHSGNVLQQQVPFGKERNQRQHDFLPLADHHLLDVINDLARHRGDAGLAFFPVAGGGQPLHRDLYPRRLEAAQDRLAAAGRAGHLLSRHLERKLNILSALAARARWHRFNNRSLTTPIGLSCLLSVTPKLLTTGNPHRKRCALASARSSRRRAFGTCANQQQDNDEQQTEKPQPRGRSSCAR